VIGTCSSLGILKKKHVSEPGCFLPQVGDTYSFGTVRKS
jgi:hypothetical protein